jgi:hypothetical protein
MASSGASVYCARVGRSRSGANASTVNPLQAVPFETKQSGLLRVYHLIAHFQGTGEARVTGNVRFG